MENRSAPQWREVKVKPQDKTYQSVDLHSNRDQRSHPSFGWRKSDVLSHDLWGEIKVFVSSEAAEINVMSTPQLSINRGHSDIKHGDKSTFIVEHPADWISLPVWGKQSEMWRIKCSCNENKDLDRWEQAVCMCQSAEQLRFHTQTCLWEEMRAVTWRYSSQ